MKIIVLLLMPFCSMAQAKPKGSPVGFSGKDVIRIGDSAWSYKGSTYQWAELKSTKQYPSGIWVDVGKPVKITCLHYPPMSHTDTCSRIVNPIK